MRRDEEEHSWPSSVTRLLCGTPGGIQTADWGGTIHMPWAVSQVTAPCRATTSWPWLWKGVSLALAGMHAQGRDRGVEAVRIVFDQAGIESGHRELG
jgi:hypothetical protein